jgi:membrane protein implicated in regulation of membrane protease activity
MAVAMCLMVALLAGATPTFLLGLWFTLNTILSFVRAIILRRFLASTGKERRYHFACYVKIAPLSGFYGEFPFISSMRTPRKI